MNYRFNGTDYTEDQMTQVADVKGYTLEELISKNPQIETINEEEDEGVKVEKPTPVESAPTSTEIKGNGVSKPEDTSSVLEENKKVEPIKVEEKPKIENVIYPEADNTKDMKKAFKNEYGVKYENIQKAVDRDVLQAEQNFQAELDKYFVDGIDKYKKVGEDGTELLNLNALEQDAYNKAVTKYKNNIDAINKKYSKERLNDYVKRYNSFLDDESKKQIDQLLIDQEKSKQDLIDFEDKIYYRYDKNGKLLGIHNYASIYDTYVAPDRLSYEEYVKIPGNENKTKREYKNTSYALPKYDSVEDYLEDYNKHGKRSGYMQEASTSTLLDEFEIVVPSNETDTDKRLDYWKKTFSGPTEAIFNDFDDNTVARILNNLLPKSFDVNAYDPLQNRIAVTNTKNDEVEYFDVFADGNKAKARSESMRLASWLAANTINEEVKLTEDNKKVLDDYLTSLQSKPAYDNEGNFTGDGLNVDNLKIPKTSNYSIGQVSDVENFSVDLFKFANKTTPAYVDVQPGRRFSYDVAEDNLDDSRYRKSQQAAFNTFIQTPGSDGKSIGISGEINYSTMPTYEQDIRRGGFGRSDKKLDTYTEIPSTYVGGEMTSQKDKDIIEYSKQNKEALFYYNKSNGEKVLFDTKKWSQENNGKNFTEFISRKAVNDVLVPEELVEEEKIVFEKTIGMDFLGDADLNKQAKIILASLNVKQDIKNNITSNKYIQKNLENKIQNFKGYSVETAQAILNIPGYEVKIRPGEDLVEVPTNYGEKVIAPKRIFDNAKAEITEFTAATQLYKKNNASQLKLIDDADNANDKWEIYKLNYSDTEANLQNFVLSTADFISSSLYGGYKYLTPYGWAMSALSAGANVKDPLTEVMLGFKEYQEKQRSYYVAPPKFGEFRTAADFGSWFFNMAGTQIPQYATMLFSGGSASIPLLIMGSSATGSTDLDFRREVIAGNKDYNEFGILWRAALSGGSEALFAGLPTWKIMNKGKSLVSGLGGNATSQFFKGGRDYLRAQVPGIIKDVTLDSGFEVINGVVQNALAERPLTEGLGEIATTSILMTGPVSVLSPTYYALTTKDFIGGNIKQRINENTYKISEIENQNKIYSKSIQKFMDAATRLAGTSDGRYARQKVQELKTKLLENLNIKMELQTEVTSDYNSLDNTFKNKGINPAGSANYNFMLSKLIELKNQAKQVNQNNNLTDSQKSKQLDDINAQYVRIDQAKEKYLNPKTYGDAWYALKGAGVFNFAAKKQYKEYVNKATENLLESGVTNENLTTEKVEQEARKLYHEKIAEDQIVKDQKVNPNLRVARTFEEAKDIINKSTTLSEEQKKNLISKLEKGTQNGFSIDEFEFAYTPNMVKNSMFHTGGHETSHRSSSILISKNPQAFKGFADQLVSFMEADHAELLEYAKQVNGNLFKDGKYDSEEVIATFIELVGAGKIKMNKNGNMPALLGFLFNKSLNNASEGEYNIPFNGQDDIVNWFIGLGKGLTDGSVTIGKYTELLAGALDIDLETGKVVKMTPEQTSKLAASEVEISDSETTLLDAINNLLPKDIDTKEKYDKFIRDERKAKPIVDALNKPGGAINNYIRSKQVSPEEGNEMIQNTLFRLFNFNPEETRADGSVVGPESFGERIFADTRFASLDARKKLAKEAEKRKQEARIDDEEARQVAARDDSEPTQTAKDRVTPKSKIPREFPEVFDQDIKDEFETAGLEIYESDLPDMSKKEFKAAVLDIFRGKLSKKVKDKLGTRKNYEFVVKKMAPKMKDLLPVQWFVRLEAQTKPEDRLFTTPPTRLTKKADIDKALLDEKVYVENLKQGVNIYEFKDFKAKQLSDYLLAPAINPITGEKSGLRGTRKTALAEGITEKLGRDVSPSTAESAGRTTREIAEISKKLQVDPRIKFSASYISNFLKEINVDYLRGYNSKGDVNKNDVRRFKEVLLKFYPFSTSTINSGTFANISSGKAKGQNFNDIDRLSMQLLLNFGEQGDVDNIYIPTKNAEEISIISKKYDGEVDGAVVKININKLNKDQLQELLKKYLKRSTKEFSLSEDKMNNVIDTFKSLNSAWVNLGKNIKNFHNDSKYIKARKSNYDGLGFIIEEFDRIYTGAKGENKKEVLQMLAGIFSTASANSSHMFRMAAYPSGYTSTYLDGSGTRKEHVIPQADLADFVFTVIADNSLDTDLAIKLIKDNFLQLYISENQDNMLKEPGFQSKMPEGYWQSWYDAIRTNDLSKAWDFESRYFHPDVNKQKQSNNTSGFNPFETYVLGESIASKYKLDNLLDNKQKKNPEVIAFTQDLIYNLATKQINTKEAQRELYYFVKKINGSSLASNKKSAANTTEVLISNSEVSDVNKFNNTNQLIDESRKLDEALKIANALNQPVKKIRVFDFDDTLAKSKSLVFYNRPNQSGKPVPNNKAIFMIGGPGSGKSNIGKGLQLGRDGWKVVNQDIFIESEKTKAGLPESEKDYTKEQRSKRAKIGAAGRKAAEAKMDKYTKAGNGMVIDGTGASYNATMKKVNKLKEQGYEVFMVHAKTSNEVALERNRARKERSLPDFIVEKTQQSVNNNIDQYKNDLGDNFIEIDTETIEYGKPLPKEFVDNAKARFYATERGKLNAEEFAEQGSNLVDQGFAMDFSDFNIVREGEKGPLFDVAKKIQKARGTDDVFVLTARAPEAQQAIYEFLKSEGLEIPLENITGLGNSTGEAKANWLVGKAAEGYNDFYFADDAYQNVKAVKKAMSVLDVKSKVQQARVKNSETLSKEFNNLLEETTGVEAFKEYSAAKAKTIGASKGKFKFFIPYSAEDFVGLIYPTLAKGSIGDAQMAWYKQNLLDPYTRAQENLSTARINLMQDFKQLKKSLDVPADLRKKNESGFTNEQAVRVFLFDQMGYEVPGLSKRDLKELKDIVIKDPKLSVFADQILTITKGDGYAKPSENWLTGTITTDLIDLINTEKRSKYLADWQQKIDAIYSKENLNKLEALYGDKYREALEGILSRMKSGRNRLNTGSRLSNRILDYINGSVGTIMFFNTRSALLQTISSINYLNWNFNNPLKAGAAFANQPQYWKDFKMLINSDYLRDRRNGLKLNISESEIADAAATSRNKAKAALNYILQKGYLPTQFADSFAIAAGGATFYRNRVNDLIKQGVELKQAEEQALIEWRQVSEESQQSADPSRISAQQSSNLGRLILAFANTPMQYARIQKRAIQDLINKRGDAKTNISKVIYYGVVQNIIFNALQQAAFAIGFGDDVDDEVKEKKYLNVANGMLDSLLRGIGIGGQAISVGKNFLMDVYERSQRDRPEYVDSVWKLTQFSPPINSKISKLKQAAWHFDNKKRRQKIFDEGFSLNNPAYEAASKVISATTNVPLDRVLYKMENIEAALDEDNDVWQRIAMLGGWPKWQLETQNKKKSSTKKKRNIGGIKIKKRKIRIK